MAWVKLTRKPAGRLRSLKGRGEGSRGQRYTLGGRVYDARANPKTGALTWYRLRPSDVDCVGDS